MLGPSAAAVRARSQLVESEDLGRRRVRLSHRLVRVAHLLSPACSSLTAALPSQVQPVCQQCHHLVHLVCLLPLQQVVRSGHQPLHPPRVGFELELPLPVLMNPQLTTHRQVRLGTVALRLPRR